jgi:hypothetical protein
MAKRPLTANELRKLAEAADGIRDKTAYVVWSGDEPQVKTKLDDGDELIVECETRNDAKKRASFTSIVLDPPLIDADGNAIKNIADKYDAMFWSEAAVEKFAIPYYARFTSPQDLARMLDAFNHPTTLAMMHPPLSYCHFMTSIRRERDGKSGVEVLGLKEFEASR